MLKFIKYTLLSLLGICLLLYVVFRHNDIPLDTLKQKYAPAPSAFIEIDGMSVHYRIEGNEADTIPLLLLHGTGASLHTWDAWVAALKGEQRIIRLDLPAYGLTGPNPERDYSLGKYADFIAHFLAKIKVKRCDIAGNSLGGGIAWNVASKYPDLVQKLILIDASGYPIHSKSTPIAFQLAKIPVIKQVFTVITPRFIVEKSVLNVYTDKSKVSDALVDRYFELSLRAGNRQAFIDRMSGGLVETNAAQRIAALQQPTLILWGEEDLLIPVENAYHFHDDLPHDTLVILKNIGHVPMEEAPEPSVAAAKAFLK
jgi:pimeloyl-ACP methyl ester carboxylesterase